MDERKQNQDYLLDDDEFARVMRYKYAKDGRPHEALVEKRIWKRLGSKKTRWVYPLSILTAVALLLIFVRPSVKEPESPTEPQVKTGVATQEVSVAWVENAKEPQIEVQTLQPRFVVIYASDDQGQRQRVHEAFQLGAQEKRIIPLALDPARVWPRICALTAENAAELERLEGMLDLVWTQISDRQCVSR